MYTIITADQLESLQTDHAGVLKLERENQQPVQVIVVPALDASGTTTYRSTTAVPADPLDDLQVATWEKAEWQ